MIRYVFLTWKGRLWYLMRQIQAKEFERYSKELKVEEDLNTFCSYYCALEKVCNRSNAEIIRNSDIEKSYYYQIMKGNRIPSRDKVIRLCIGAGLSVEETNYALILNDNAPLYLCRHRDRGIAYAINKGLSVTETNLLLDELGDRMLH